MAALAKKKTVHVAAAWRGRSELRAAHEADRPQESAVHLQQAMLEAAFSESAIKPYPGPVKFAILVGAPVALWAGVFAIVGHLLQA